MLAAWDQGPEPSDADWDWLAVEAAAAALQDKGPDEALSRVWESMPGTDLDTCLAEVRATGHPDAAELCAGGGGVRRLRRAAQHRPGGRAEGLAGGLPAADLAAGPPAGHRHLADLHEVIQVLFGWDGDHLHVFQAGKKHYSDPFMDLDEARNEEAVRVRSHGARREDQLHL